jgi:endonuclease/exonuclease/phosphatase family metal-dependent hydrolase
MTDRARSRRVGRNLVIGLVAATLVALLAAPGTGAGTPRPVKLMTQNLYLGSDLVPVLTATTLPQLLAGAATVYRQVEANDFPTRARALAAQIRDADPLVVGLQEASKWSTGDPGVLDGPRTPATQVTYDYLELLLAALAEEGIPFDVYETRLEFDAEVPSLLGYDVRLQQRDAILVRSGLPATELTVVGSAQGDFAANKPIAVAGSAIPVHRGWSSVDVTANRRTLRVVNTHLEPVDASLRVSQATELVAAGGPTDAAIPVVLVGDLNSGPVPAAPAAYEAILAGGFRDTWAEIAPTDPGLTCCQAPDLRNATSQLDRRIDVVLIDAGVALRARRYGADPDGRTANGLWPSDHAGVAVAIAP